MIWALLIPRPGNYHWSDNSLSLDKMTTKMYLQASDDGYFEMPVTAHAVRDIKKQKQAGTRTRCSASAAPIPEERLTDQASGLTAQTIWSICHPGRHQSELKGGGVGGTDLVTLTYVYDYSGEGQTGSLRLYKENEFIGK